MQRFRHNCLLSELKWNISVLYYTLVKMAVEFLGLPFFCFRHIRKCFHESNFITDSDFIYVFQSVLNDKIIIFLLE